MEVTIQQIAEKASVSVPTARHILGNRADQYRLETRDRVLRIAQDLGYRPHSSARAMRTGSFGCIALLLSTKKHISALPPGLLEGIHDALAVRNLHLTLARVPDNRLTDEQELPKFLREWMADGLIINYTHDIPERLLKLIRHHNMPSIWTNADLSEDCVRPDDYSAGREATKRLALLGHQRIAYLSFIAPTHYSSLARKQGYIEAMLALQREPRCLLAESEEKTIHKIAHCREWLSGPNRPTAIVTYSDLEIRSLLAAARSLGLRVPHELSVATTAVLPVEDSETGLQIATWILPEYLMGQESVTMLLQKIAKPEQALPVCPLPLTMCEGESCVPPP